jgi:hypothetical protein
LKTAGGNAFKSGIRLRHFDDTDGFNIEDDEHVGTNGLNIVRYPQGTPASALFIDRFTGNTGIGTTTPATRLDVAGGGWFRSESGGLPASAGVGVRIKHESATGGGNIFAYNYATGSPTNLILQQPGGNVGIGVTTPATALHVAGTITCTALNQTSDRNAKENFAPVNAEDVLAKIAALPITQWNFKTEPGVAHLGPMAQDFHAAFNLGQNDTTIATVDESGVALAAIQALAADGRSQRSEISGQKAEIIRLRSEATADKESQQEKIKTLEQTILDLRARLEALEKK